MNYDELYDVFYSDADGNFSSSGEYITIEAVWPRYQDAVGGPIAGGGLNIAAVYLTFLDSSTKYADITTSYVAFGDNQVAASFGWATDGDEATATTMGNTIQPGHPDRLRITVGFRPSEPPPPGVPGTRYHAATRTWSVGRVRYPEKDKDAEIKSSTSCFFKHGVFNREAESNWLCLFYFLTLNITSLMKIGTF
ncbi:MAG: hypothetical protein MZV70_07185 [Desulfobacterales bacterium]|nr:hypothetical protein [Desulfobacterales bacterium]